MKRFRYALDPLFLGACLFYALNRWGIKPFTDWSFFHNTFNDLLLIPAALPLLLLVQRGLGLRKEDKAPDWGEIAGHWLVWSLLSEWILPHFFSGITGDPLDVPAYAAGACFAGIWWGWFYSSRCDFDWIAPYYSWMERLAAGNLMQKGRTFFLSSLSGKILLAGEGPGRCLEALLRGNPSLEITCLDQSGKMLELARRRVRRAGFSGVAVDYICRDILETELPADTYDGISTPFFLDCFSGDVLREVIRRLSRAAKPGALWIWVDFRIPEQGWQRVRARTLVGLMMVFFRAVTGLQSERLENVEAHLEALGWKQLRHCDFDHGLVRAVCWQKTG